LTGSARAAAIHLRNQEAHRITAETLQHIAAVSNPHMKAISTPPTVRREIDHTNSFLVTMGYKLTALN